MLPLERAASENPGFRKPSRVSWEASEQMETGTTEHGEPQPTRETRSPPPRTEIIDLALEILAEQGLGAVTYRSLASAAGCSTNPIVTQFPTKASILEAVFERAWERAGIRAGEAESPEPLETLFEVCSRAVPISEPTDPAIRAYFELLFETSRNPELRSVITLVEETGQPAYLRLIARAQDAGEIDPGLDPEDVLYAIWSLGDGLCLDAYTYPEEFTPERTRRVWELGFRAIVSARPS